MKFSTCLAIILALVCCQVTQASSRRRLPEHAKGTNSTSRAIAVWPYYGNSISNQQPERPFFFHWILIPNSGALTSFKYHKSSKQVNIVVKDVQDQVIPSIQWIGAVITTTSAILKKNVTKRTAPAPTTSSSKFFQNCQTIVFFF